MLIPLRASRMCLLSLFCSLSLFICCIAFAALPPAANNARMLGELEAAQKSRGLAPDVVQIEVLSVDSSADSANKCPEVKTYTVKAKLKSVQRGQLKVGDAVEISYKTRVYLCPGPQTRNPRPLTSGATYDAYLKCAEGRCELMGGAWSFDSESDFQSALKSAQAAAERFKQGH